MNDAWQLAIDFGTTFTAAAVRSSGQAETVKLGQTLHVLPSSVLKTGDGYIVGEEAVSRAPLSPTAFVRTPKRRLGLDTYVSMDGEDVPTVHVVAAVFDRVLTDVLRTRPTTSLERIVLTHPAVWPSARTDDLVKAFQLSAAAHDVPTALCTEPAGAAYEYVGLTQRDAMFAVYDLGGGTLDTAVLHADGGTGFDLIGMPMGDDALGGEDFDDAIVHHLVEGLRQQSPALADDLMTSVEPEWANARHLLHEGARHAKEELSLYPAHAFRVPAPVSRDLSLTRDELNELIADDVGRSVDILEESIANAEQLTGERVTSVYLVGGSSRIPAISTTIEQRLDITCHTREQPKEVVSLGATLLPETASVIPGTARATERSSDDGRSTRGINADGTSTSRRTTGNGTGPSITSPPGASRDREDGAARPKAAPSRASTGPPATGFNSWPTRAKVAVSALVGALALAAVFVGTTSAASADQRQALARSAANLHELTVESDGLTSERDELRTERDELQETVSDLRTEVDELRDELTTVQVVSLTEVRKADLTGDHRLEMRGVGCEGFDDCSGIDELRFPLPLSVHDCAKNKCTVHHDEWNSKVPLRYRNKTGAWVAKGRLADDYSWSCLDVVAKTDFRLVLRVESAAHVHGSRDGWDAADVSGTYTRSASGTECRDATLKFSVATPR